MPECYLQALALLKNLKVRWKALFNLRLSDETFSLLVGMKQTKTEGNENVMVYVGS